MLRQISGPRKPMRILEVGAGTGAVTTRILEKMIDGDVLVICELNPRFMELLKEKLELDPNYQRHKARVEFFQGYVQDLSEEKPFDTLVCALPFLNFDLSTVKDIFSKFKRLSHEGTLMTYYEYIGLRKLGKVAAVPRIEEIDGFFRALHAKQRLGLEKVWLNVLPINIYTVRLAA